MADKNKNTRNSQSVLFRRLTRLLSGPLVNYRTQTNHRLRRIDLDKYSSRFTSASGKHFKKSAYSPYDSLQAQVLSGMQRTERYVDFDQMEYTPEIASTLDIYADEMTTHSKIQPLMSIDCPNQEIKSVLEGLYYNVLNVEYNLFSWCRSMCKYGDFFLYLDIDESRGIQSGIGLPTQELERLEGEDKTNPNYVQFQWNTAGITFENWQVAHFRILGNDKYAPYGSSVLEPARRIWRQLTLLEDAMMAYRIVRSPERRVFKIDVGNIPPQDVEQYMQKVMTQMKRNQVVDPSTGRVDLRYNPLSIDEDYFIPVRGQSATDITALPGGKYAGDIDDVKYLRDKLFSALKVPPSYLARSTDSGEDDKGTLAQKDIRFARTVQRLQRSITTELEKIGIIHLYTMGYRDTDLVSFKLSLNNPSKIAQLQELEHWKVKFDIAGAATEGYFSKSWVAKNIFGMSSDEFVRNRREIFSDRMYEADLETAAEQAQAAATGAAGEGAGDLGADLGADLGGGGLPDLGAATPPATEAPALDKPPEPEAQGELLTAPGKKDDDVIWQRPDGKTTTPKSKGKLYNPVGYDNREGTGPRKKNMKASYSKETSGSNRRNLFPGLQGLTSISRGIYEDVGTNYHEEERKLFEVTKEMQDLISKLETREKDET